MLSDVSLEPPPLIPAAAAPKSIQFMCVTCRLKNITTGFNFRRRETGKWDADVLNVQVPEAGAPRRGGLVTERGPEDDHHPAFDAKNKTFSLGKNPLREADRVTSGTQGPGGGSDLSSPSLKIRAEGVAPSIRHQDRRSAATFPVNMPARANKSSIYSC